MNLWSTIDESTDKTPAARWARAVSEMKAANRDVRQFAGDGSSNRLLLASVLPLVRDVGKNEESLLVTLVAPSLAVAAGMIRLFSKLLRHLFVRYT